LSACFSEKINKRKKLFGTMQGDEELLFCSFPNYSLFPEKSKKINGNRMGIKVHPHPSILCAFFII